MRGALIILAAALLAGCGMSNEEEIRGWMDEQRQIKKPSVKPIPEPKKFQPQLYTQKSSAEPFSNQKLARASGADPKSAAAAAASAALLAPELARRKEPLESYPLDTMVMVGSLLKSGQPVALLKV